MKRNGKTKSGSQRWRCVGCGASATHSIDTAARDLAAFVGWLLSKDSQVDMPGKGRTLSEAPMYVNLLFSPEISAKHRILPGTGHSSDGRSQRSLPFGIRR